MRTGLLLVVAGCSAPPQPVTNVAIHAPPAPSRTPPPTLANAGAPACTAKDPVLLGPHGEGDAVLGFGPAGGLAAWKRDHGVLAVRPIGLDATPRGPGATVAVAEGIEPRGIYALADRFIVVLRRWDWQTQDLRWWAVVVDGGGRSATPPVDLGLADLDILHGQVLDAHRIGLVVGPDAMSKDPNRPARWQTLDAGASLASAAGGVLDLAGLDGEWREAELAGTRGWVVERAGGRAPDGIFAGRRTPADGAVVADPIEARVTNAAVPPGRGVRGQVIEAMGRPVLERVHRGQPVGERLRLERDGNPIAHGMTIASELAWSGTHFVYPFWDDDGGPTHDTYAVRLLPIDCRP